MTLADIDIRQYHDARKPYIATGSIHPNDLLPADALAECLSPLALRDAEVGGANQEYQYLPDTRVDHTVGKWGSKYWWVLGLRGQAGGSETCDDDGVGND